MRNIIKLERLNILLFSGQKLLLTGITACASDVYNQLFFLSVEELLHPVVQRHLAIICKRSKKLTCKLRKQLTRHVARHPLLQGMGIPH